MMFEFHCPFGRPHLQGRPLPEEFGNLPVLKGVAIAGDGHRYAYVFAAPEVIVGDVLSDGIFEVADQRIEVRRISGGRGHTAIARPVARMP